MRDAVYLMLYDKACMYDRHQGNGSCYQNNPKNADVLNYIGYTYAIRE
jgi:hypothetical protein